MAVHLGPLEDLPDTERARVRELAVERSWRAGDWLYHGGDVADRIYVVQSGVVAVQVEPADGLPVTLTLLGGESLFGELTFLGPRRRTAGVTALVPTVTASVALDALAAIARRSPAALEAIMGVMADTIRRLSGQLIEARHDPQALRLRRLLARLPRLFGTDRVPLTQDQLGHLIGAQRTTVSELLAAEVTAGRVRTGRGWVEIIDAAGLRGDASQAVPAQGDVPTL